MPGRGKTRKSTQPGAYTALCIALLALVINFWSWSLLSPLGGPYAKELSLTPVMLSFLLAVPVIIGSVGRIPLGILADKFGGRNMFAATSLLAIIPTVGLAFSESYQQLLVAALLLGIGGASFVIGIPYLSAWFPPERRGLMLGIYSTGNAGTALAGFMTPRLSDQIGRDNTFLIVAGLLLLTTVILIVWGREAPKQKRAKSSSSARLVAAARTRLTWDLASIYVITFGAFVAFGVYLPVLLSVWYGLSLTDAATRAAGFVLLATVARPVGGWLSDRVGGTRVVRISLLAVTILALFVAIQPTLYLHTTAAYLALAFALGCANGAVLALVGKLSKPEILGSITGIIGACGGLGGFVPPLILGFTYQQSRSYAPALIMLSASALVALMYVQKRFRTSSLYNPTTTRA